HAAAGGKAPWSLPARWRRPPAGLDLGTPLDFVSTNDIIGGNSASHVLNKNLELVGLIFDGNIEFMSGDFIYTDERARSISVDARPIAAALRTAYGAGRTGAELAKPEFVDPHEAAFREAHGLQCGFCTPGVLMALVPFLREHPDPDERQIREALSGNLCRCTGYQNIVAAVRLACGAPSSPRA